METNVIKENIQIADQNPQDNYLFFSSLELIDFFCNNLAEKDIKTQAKRIFEMARVFMDKKDFTLEDIYSMLVMVRRMEDREVINQVFRLYFKEGNYPIRVFVQISELESTADIEMEFSAFRGTKKFINTDKGHLPDGPFSQGVVIEDYAHCSGVRPLDPGTRKLVQGDFKQQVRQCIENLNVVLNAAGTDLQNAYSFMVYVKDLELLPQVEAVFSEYFSDDSEVLQEVTKIDRLNEDHEIEISCSAYLKDR